MFFTKKTCNSVEQSRDMDDDEIGQLLNTDDDKIGQSQPDNKQCSYNDGIGGLMGLCWIIAIIVSIMYILRVL